MTPTMQGETLTRIGARLMMTTAPLVQTVIGIPMAAVTFTTGWALTRAAHALRASRPEVCAPPPELDEAIAELLG